MAYKELVSNVAKAAGLAAVSIVALHATGLTAEDINRQFQPLVSQLSLLIQGIMAGSESGVNIDTATLIKELGPYAIGFISGWIQNTALIPATLKKLEGKTVSNPMPTPYKADDDGGLYFKIVCIDGRIHDENAGRVPGGAALTGSPIASTALAMVGADLLGNDTEAAKVVLGFGLGSNIQSALLSNLALYREIQKITKAYPNSKIKIEIENHWSGCGAQGMTNIPGWIGKFGIHKTWITDFLGLPNEVASNIWINGLGAVGNVLSGGDVSVSASLIKHSHINESKH
jgi:hypothetical protein